MRLSGFASLLVLLGCGDGLVDGSYPGEPVFTISGLVRYEDAGEELPEEPIIAGIMWEGLDEDEDIDLGPALRIATTFPARYQLDLFAAPPESLEPTLESAWLAMPVLYADSGGDEFFDPAIDEVWGGAQGGWVLYTEETWSPTPPDDAEPPPGDAPEIPVFEPGFHVVYFEDGCPGSMPTAGDALDFDLYVRQADGENVGEPCD